MVRFDLTAGGFSVVVNGKALGYISKDRGFFTDSTVIQEFVEVSSRDLRFIAEKAEEVQNGNGT